MNNYDQAKQNALEIMSHVYDPFHDDEHVLEVEQTAIKIFESLSKKQRDKVDLELLRLACLYHDTSRKFIKSNILLQPFLDGLLSGRIAFDILNKLGYTKEQSQKVKEIINSHETLLGLLKKIPDTSGKIFSDADIVEAYSVARLERGLDRFRKGMFSKRLLNLNILVLTYIHKKMIYHFNFEKSRQLYTSYIEKLAKFLEQNTEIFRTLLYMPIYQRLYTIF